MRTIGMPAGMWALFAGSFQRKLTDVLGYDRKTAARVTKAARREYRKLIGGLPDFEKGDRFRMNIVSCAMLAAFVLNMPRRPRVDEQTAFYTAAMMTEPMKWFCRRAGKRKFSPEDIKGMKETAAFRAADRNPYSWNMEFLPYPDGSGYEARFSKCGICTLMRELGLGDLIPAMCRLDYTMSEAGGADIFVRQYTLASGGPYCDCGYNFVSTSANGGRKRAEARTWHTKHAKWRQRCNVISGKHMFTCVFPAKPRFADTHFMRVEI